MKKMLLAAAAFCVLLTSVNSMALSFNAGLKGGLGLGNLYGKGITNMDTAADSWGLNPSFTGYGFFAANFTDNFAAQIELGYSNKGKTWTVKSMGGTLDVSENFGYFEVPILAKGMYPVGIFTPMLYAGPNLGFLVSATSKMKMDIPGYPKSDTTITIPDSARNGFDFGLTLGGGTAIKAGPGDIIVDLRYTFGFLSIPKLSDADKASGMKDSDVEMKTGALAIMVGYQFKF